MFEDDDDDDYSFLEEIEKTAILIDGLSTHQLTRQLAITLNYRKLLKFFKSRTHVRKAYYFTPIDRTGEESPVAKRLDWLSFNGFICCLTEYDGNGDRDRRASIEIDFVIRALSVAHEVDHLILFTGAGKFVPLVKELDRMGKTVTVCSSVHGENRHISQSLRKAADNFIDIYDIREYVQMKSRTVLVE